MNIAEAVTQSLNNLANSENNAVNTQAYATLLAGASIAAAIERLAIAIEADHAQYVKPENAKNA